jgi:hypothetical protein
MEATMREIQRNEVIDTAGVLDLLDFDPPPLTLASLNLYDEISNITLIYESMRKLCERINAIKADLDEVKADLAETNADLATEQADNAILRELVLSQETRLAWQGERISMLAADEAMM